MAAYESVFIIRPDLDEDTVGKVCERITALVAANQGAVLSLEKIGHRHLAYEVKGFQDGYYVVMNYEGQAETTSELERTFKISDEVIRYLNVRKEVSRRPNLPPKSGVETTAAGGESEPAPPATGLESEAVPAETKPEPGPIAEGQAEGETGNSPAPEEKSSGTEG